MLLTPSPPPVSVHTAPRRHDAETVLLHPLPPNASMAGAALARRRPLRRRGLGALVLERASTREPSGQHATPLATRPSRAAAAGGPTTARRRRLCGAQQAHSSRFRATSSPTRRCAAIRVTCLKFTTFVKSGVTLTIEKGTTIYGDTATRGTLVIQPGARLVARGTSDEPIVFTSENMLSRTARPGDWGGLIVLGHAPINLRGIDGRPARGRIEGIKTGGEYGGANPDDDSGILEFVRIEWSGTEIAPNNEINGLTLGGVGSRTKLSHIEVRNTADDCFEFFGGHGQRQAPHLRQAGRRRLRLGLRLSRKTPVSRLVSQLEDAPGESNGLRGRQRPERQRQRAA